MKKLLLLSTGGTIASVASNAGLVPKETGEELIKMLGKLPYDIHVKNGSLSRKISINTAMIMMASSFHTGRIRWLTPLLCCLSC